MSGVSEANVEEAALDWLRDVGWAVAYGPDIAPDAVATERDGYAEGFLSSRLRGAIERLNPDLPAEAQERTCRALTQPEGATLEHRNRAFHRLLGRRRPVTDGGVDVKRLREVAEMPARRSSLTPRRRPLAVPDLGEGDISALR